MARMQRIAAWLGLSLVTASMSTGCVSTEKYAAQKMRSDQLAEQLAAAQSNVGSATAQNDVFKQQMERIRSSGDNQAALLVNQASTIAELSRQLDDLNAKYKGAVDNIGKAGATPLSPQLTNELTAFATQNADVVDFDSATGLVKFKSDVTFMPGSAEVTPAARSAVERFAQILNAPAAAPYDLMVVGHTDAQPVSNPATVKAGHLDNWYLSAHRAIGVSKVLRQQGVSPGRIEVAGFADQRPIDPSPTKDAMSRNRRVEVLITPHSGHASAVAAAVPASGTAPAAPRKAAAKPMLNKDAPTVEIDRRPSVNK